MKVSDLLKNNMFPDFKLLAGEGGVDNEICEVFILDSPDFCNWMRGGELVVGNGYVFHNSPDEFPAFLKKLASNNAAALGIKFERFRFAHNYDEIIQIANSLNFPLIEIPFKYTWSTIYEGVYRGNKKITDGKSIMPTDIFTVIEERMDPLDLAHQLHARIDRKILVYSKKLQLSHHIDTNFETKFLDYAKEFKHSPVVERMRQRHVGSIAITTQSSLVNGELFKCASYKICGIEICVQLQQSENALSLKTEKIVINTLLIYYLMVMDEVLMIDSTKQKLNSYLERLLMGRYSDSSKLETLPLSLNANIPLPCRILLFYREDRDTVWLQRELQPISALSCLLGGKMVLIVSRDVFETKQRHIDQIATDNNILGIYSDEVSSPGAIADAFSELRESLVYMEKLRVSAGFYSYPELLVTIAMARLAETREGESILKKYWKPLAESSIRRTVPLDKFAAALIDEKFNLSKVSLKLNIHYNTARNYLDEVENALNMNLDHSEARFLLMIGRNLASSAIQGDLYCRKI